MRARSVHAAVALALLAGSASAQVIWDQHASFNNAPFAPSTVISNRPLATSEAADDFCLNATITRVNVQGYSFVNPTGLYLRFYAQAAGGKPGAVLREYYFPAGDNRWTRAGNQEILNLAATPFVATGRTLMSVQLAATQQGGQGAEWQWLGDFEEQSVTGQAYWWRNPGGGWDRGNLTWGQVENKDLAFTLYGTMNGGTLNCAVLPPDPAGTTRWTLANSPVNITQPYELAAGETLIIDPGVVVNVSPGVSTTFTGHVIANGTAAAPVRLNGNSNTVRLEFSHADFTFTDFNVQVKPYGHVTFTDCNFLPFGVVEGYKFVSMTRVNYNADYGMFLNGAIRLDDVASSRTVRLEGGVYKTRNVRVAGASGRSTLDGSGLRLRAGIQDTFIEGFTLLNNAGAGIYVAGGNVLVGANNTIQGNATALELGGGILAGSVLPPTGNRDNGFISVGKSITFLQPGQYPYSFPGSSVSDIVWQDIGLPFIVGDQVIINPDVRSITLEPGVDVRMGLDASMISFGGRFHIEGAPGNPVMIAAENPARPWNAIVFASNDGLIDDADISGAEVGFAGLEGFNSDVTNSVFHDNMEGARLGIRARGVRFEHNGPNGGVTQFGYDPGSAKPQVNGLTNPNSFVNNYPYGVWDNLLGIQGTINAEHNWWGSPSGPRSDDNPGGTGDATYGFVDAVPFRTEPPAADHPPVIKMMPVDYIEVNSTIGLHWTASDDHGIVYQRVEYQRGGHAEGQWTTIADNLPPHQRSVQWTVPEMGLVQPWGETWVRVSAFDERGQIGFYELIMPIPDAAHASAQAAISPSHAGQTYEPYDTAPLLVDRCCYDEFLNGGGTDIYVELMNDDHTSYLSAMYLGNVPLSRIEMPAVSTDQARFVVVPYGGGNRLKFVFGEPFSIRPDARLGDAPPSVQITAPSPGAALTGGSTVPISWTASDDAGVRSAKVYISYTGGRTWLRLAEGLPGPSGTLAVQLPPGSGFADVRLRVVGVDTIFQNSSATIPVTIQPGELPPERVCGTADFDGDSDVGTDRDIEAFFACLAGNCCPTCWRPGADFDGDGDVGTDRDIEAFFRVLAGNAC